MSKVKKYYWLKLKNDFFTSRAMKKLRKIAGGDTYTIIYLKLQLLSIENEGRLFYEGVEPTFAEEMALALDEEVENMEATLIFLEKTGLLKQETETDFLLCEVPYLIGSETDKASMMRKIRKERKALSGNNVTNVLPNVTDELPSVTDELPSVTKCYTEIEIEKELDLEKESEIELEKEKEREQIRVEERGKPSINYQEIVDMYNDTCVSFPEVKTISESRKKAIKARRNFYSIDDFQEMFEKAECSDFLKGKNDRNWRATFDWMIKDSNMAKILEGNYDNRDRKSVYDNMGGWADA